MAYQVLKSTEECKEFLDNHSESALYLVGAGEFGEMVGSYLNERETEWKGVIDKKGMGTCCGRPIYSYDSKEIDDEAFFFITSIQYMDVMIEELMNNGIDPDRIAVAESRRFIYELYGEVNSLMKRMLDGSYRSSTFGEVNPSTTYMIIERSMIYEGVFSNVRRFLMGIDYADRMGYIPVIDQVYYPAFEYQDYETVGIDNPWEYFFEQPGNADLSFVTRCCKNVRYYNMDDTINFNYLSEPIRINKNGIWRTERWHNLIMKYIRLNKRMQRMIDEKYQELFPHDGSKVLGVKIREGMKINVEKKCGRGAIPLQPETDRIFSDIKKNKEKWGCQYVFVMCETEDVLCELKREYGEHLIYLKYIRQNYSEFPSATEITRNKLHGSDNKIQQAETYITETYLLAKCDALISGDNGATEMACLIKGGYDNMILYYDGYSPNYTA